MELEPRLDELPPSEWAATCMAALAGIGCLGTEERGLGESLRVLAWLPEDADVSGIPALLLECGLSARIASTSSVEDPGWVEQFNASLKPVDVGRRLTILPRPGPAPEGRIVLVIEPGRAFGTGHHESTRLALVHLDEQIAGGESVLDVGTGSGVLALAAVRLGASRATGIDIDPEAIEVARGNVADQPEAAAISLITSADPAGVKGEFDLVLANIQRDVLEPMLPQLCEKLARGGRLILSGLLLEDREPMERALGRQGLEASWKQEGEWISPCARRA